MRRLAYAAAVCGTLALAACSDQTPSEPTPPPPEELISPRCRPSTHFPIVQVSGLIAKVFPRGKLQLEALVRAGAITLFWETCRKPAAQKAAVDFVNFMNANSSKLTGTRAQRNTLISLILNGVGIPFITPPLGTGDFGLGIFNPSNPNNTLIKTLNGTALVELEPGSFGEQTVIVITRRPDGSDPLNFDGNQVPPFWDYDAINASGDHVLEEGHTGIIAFCLLDTDVQSYPASRRIGHNPVFGAPGFPFEILEEVNLAAERPDLAAALNCGNLAPNTTLIGGFGRGVPGLANAAWRNARYYLAPAARALFLPEALHAATLALIKLPPPAGRTPSLSPFGVVDATTSRFGFENGEPEWTGTAGGFWNRNTLVGVENLAFDTYVSTVGNALPDPFAGSYSAWYGDPLTGNFLGAQAPLDPEHSGGTSVAPNGGSFTSPEFTVPNVTNPVQLQLKTWWEIESVNPAGFDLMDIVLLHGGAETLLKRLNPPADPVDPDPALAYTSAGFNVAPDWRDVAIDLSAYKGQIVRLKFVFATGDQNYNGFRGWIVDQVVVQILAPSPSLGLRTNAVQSKLDLVPADKMTFPDRNK